MTTFRQSVIEKKIAIAVKAIEITLNFLSFLDSSRVEEIEKD